jgi:hypothetical protein
MTTLTQKLAKISTVSQTFVLTLAILAQIVAPLKAQAIDSTKMLAISQKTSTVAVADTLTTPGAEIVVPETPKPNKVVAGVLTAYSSTPDQTDSDPFTAASGKQVYLGMVANNCLPFGTKLKITFTDAATQEKYGNVEFMVDDRMNSRYGCNRFDVWLDAPRKEVNQFGVKRASIEVYLQKKIAKVKPVKKVVELADAK